MSENIIEMLGLKKKYGSFTAVENLNLTIKKGEIFGLLGPNGAGKSTAILMMLGLTEPNEGSVKVCGIDSTRNPIQVKKCVGYLPEDVGFYDEHTGLENLIYTARLNGIPKKIAVEKASRLMDRVGLGEQKDKKAGKYSRGMRQRLGLADVLIKNPKVIILDEPTLGIDPTGVREFLQMIVDLSKEEKITVLFSSHHLHQVQQVCDRVGLFVSGKLLAAGNIKSLSQTLIAGAPFTIELGIAHTTAKANDPGNHSRQEEETREMLMKIKGVEKVSREKENYRIECSRDLTTTISREVMNSGATINYLNRKEFGLDDIYHLYFEGGIRNE